MAKGHRGIPKARGVQIEKRWLLDQVTAIDNCKEAKERVLKLEVDFRKRIKSHAESLPPGSSRFQKFNTNPFVIMIHCMKHGYATVKEVEEDILPAKLFSSMETSAGKMAELVTLPVYGWDTEATISTMHSANSALDGQCIDCGVLKVATLKSGPKCLNDGMSANLADAVLANARSWADAAGVKKIDFTYGVLYGTPKQSNKKDWHILRNLEEKSKKQDVLMSPNGRWDCEIMVDGVAVHASVRIGKDWWFYLGGESCFVEVCLALVRACVKPAQSRSEEAKYTISDLAQIVSIKHMPDGYNAAILQREQFEWLFFLARHFGDSIVDLPSEAPI